MNTGRCGCKKSETAVEGDRSGGLFFCRMALGNAAHQSERPEGIETLAVVFAGLPAVFLLRDPADSLQEIPLRRTVGVDEEDLFSFRKVVFRPGEQRLREAAVIDAGGKADPVITGQVRRGS